MKINNEEYNVIEALKRWYPFKKESYGRSYQFLIPTLIGFMVGGLSVALIGATLPLIAIGVKKQYLNLKNRDFSLFKMLKNKISKIKENNKLKKENKLKKMETKKHSKISTKSNVIDDYKEDVRKKVVSNFILADYFNEKNKTMVKPSKTLEPIIKTEDSKSVALAKPEAKVIDPKVIFGDKTTIEEYLRGQIINVVNNFDEVSSSKESNNIKIDKLKSLVDTLVLLQNIDVKYKDDNCFLKRSK